MAKTPGRREHQPDRPARAPDNHHAGRRPHGRLLSVEGAHTRNERTRIPAPVRMMRPDELPAATLSFLHPALTSIPATTSYSPRLRAVIAQARSCPAVTVAPIARTDFLTAANRASYGPCVWDAARLRSATATSGHSDAARNSADRIDASLARQPARQAH